VFYGAISDGEEAGVELGMGMGHIASSCDLILALWMEKLVKTRCVGESSNE